MAITNLIGQTFNYLTVIDGPIKKEGSRKIYWKCKCKCGNETIVRGDGLKSGSTKSCGCYKKQILIDNNIKRQTLNLTGQRFGKLVAIEATDQRSSDGRVIWKCQCDCGNICYVDTHCLQQSKTISCGCLRSKGELIVEQLLIKNNINFEKQKTFDNCRFSNNYLAKFDFWIENKYLIEYDGETHYIHTHNGWYKEGQLEAQQERDRFKNNWCKENNIPLIRIPYTHLNDLCIEDLILETSKFII